MQSGFFLKKNKFFDRFRRTITKITCLAHFPNAKNKIVTFYASRRGLSTAIFGKNSTEQSYPKLLEADWPPIPRQSNHQANQISRLLCGDCRCQVLLQEKKCFQVTDR